MRARPGGLRLRYLWALLIAVAPLGCADAELVDIDGATSGDARVRDAGAPDAARPDAGPEPRDDAGAPDAGTVCRSSSGLRPGIGVEGTVCEVRRAPERPRSCPPDDRSTSLLRALRRVDLQPAGGYDLDGHCSTAEGGAQSCEPLTATAAREGMHGADNAFGTEILLFLGLLDSELEARYAELQEEGFGTPLLQVDDWNGEMNDPDVTVTFIVAIGVEGDGLAVWDGSDTFIPSDDWYDAGEPAVVDTNAYVADGRLVAALPDRVPISLPLNRIAEVPLVVQDGKVVARIAPDGSLSDIYLFGRWSIADALDALPALGLCPDAEEYLLRQATAALTRAADVRLHAAEDGGDPLLPCSAISVQIKWESSAPATLGTPATPELALPCE